MTPNYPVVRISLQLFSFQYYVTNYKVLKKFVESMIIILHVTIKVIAFES